MSTGDKVTTLGKYTLVRELGRGGMGVVYEAVDTALNRKVALKLMLGNPNAEPEQQKQEEQRFIKEAQLSAGLPKHPHLVSVYEAGTIGDKRYLAMEYIQGKSLARWRAVDKPPFKRQIELMRDVAAAVAHAHKNSVIHRDLKPENILVDAQGQPHITDFGLAKTLGQDVSVSLTVSGMIVGTPTYMSPEQAQGSKGVDHRTDLYALGAMLYETLTGRPPFQGDTIIELLMKTVKNPVPPPSSVTKVGAMFDKPLENICLKALAKNPRARYQTGDALAADLTRWLRGEAVHLLAPATVRATAAPAKSKTWLAAGIGVAVVAVLGLGIALRPSGPSEPAKARTRGDDADARVAAAEEAAERRAKKVEEEKQREIEKIQRAADEKTRAAEQGKRELEEKLRAEQAIVEAERKRIADEKRAAEEKARLIEEARAKAEEAVKGVVPPSAPPPPAEPRRPALAASEPAFLAVPEAAKLKEAERTARETFKADYARKSPADQQALAHKLLQQGRDTTDDAALRYVLLREAKDVGAQSGEVSIVTAAIHELARGYAVDALDLGTAALATVAKVAKTPDASARLTEAYLGLIEHAVAADNYDGAAALFARTEAAAKPAQNPALNARVQARKRDVEDLRKEWAKVKPALKTIEAKPDDADANLALGKFLCFLKRSWAEGLPRLAKGSDAAWRSAAEKDLAGAPEAGDAWWDLSEKQPPALKQRLQERAVHGYERAWGRASGADKSRLRDRLKAGQMRPRPLRGPVDMTVPWWDLRSANCTIDDTYAHTGTCSFKLSKPAGATADAGANTARVPARGGEQFVLSFWVLTEATSTMPDVVAVNFYGADGNYSGGEGPAITVDQPFWTCLEKTVTCPPGTTAVGVSAFVRSVGATIWLDDVSLKRVGDPRELSQNSSFEQR